MGITNFLAGLPRWALCTVVSIIFVCAILLLAFLVGECIDFGTGIVRIVSKEFDYAIELGDILAIIVFLMIVRCFIGWMLKTGEIVNRLKKIEKLLEENIVTEEKDET